MNRYITLILLFVLAFVNANSEESKNTNFFLSANVYLNGNIYSSSFTELPGYDNCCTNFKSTFGLGPAFGIGGEYQFEDKLFGRNFRYVFKIIYDDLSAKYSQDEHIGNNIVGNTYEKIISNFRLEPSINILNTEHLIALYPTNDRLSVVAGLQVGLPLTMTVYQIEKIKSPKGLSYSDTGTDERGEAEGDIKDAASVFAGILLGVRYEAYRFDNFAIVPEILFSYPLNNVISSLEWKINTVKAGVSLSYNIPKRVPEPIAPPMRQPMPNLDLPLAKEFDYELAGRFTHIKLKDTMTLPLLVIKDEYVDYSAVVPKFFFKHGTDELSFSLKSNSEFGKNIDMKSVLQKLLLNNYEFSYQIGTSSDEPEELFEKRKKVILDMAQAIGVANSDEFKFKHVRTNTAKLSNELKEEASYFAITDELGKPVVARYHNLTKETYQVPYNSVVFTSATPLEGSFAESYQVLYKFDNKIFFSSNKLTDSAYVTEEMLGGDYISSRKLQIQSKLTSTEGLVREKEMNLTIEPRVVKINKITNFEDGKELMMLCFFEFDSSEVSSFDKNVIDQIYDNLNKGKKVKIVPSTDYLGTAKYNRDLALKRANAAIALARLPEGSYTIEMPDKYFFDNKDPIGRVLNRCVVVIIE